MSARSLQYAPAALALTLLCLTSPLARAEASQLVPPSPSPASPSNWLNIISVESAGDVTTVSAEDVVEKLGQDPESVLANVPGVNETGYTAASQPSISYSFSLRGLGGGTREGGISRALVTVDGVPFNDPFFGSVQWSRLPLDDIKQVQIVHGGSSALWGNYAEGGVANFITASDTTDQVALHAGAGSYGTYHFAISGAATAGDDNTLQALVQLNGTDGYRQVAVSRQVSFIVPTNSDAANIHVDDLFAPSPDLRARFSLSYHHDHQRFQTPLDTSAQQNLDLSADIEKRIPNGRLAFTAFYGHELLELRESTFSLDSFGPPIDKLNDAHRVPVNDGGGSLVWSRQSDGPVNGFLAGVDWHFISGEDRRTNFFLPDHLSGRAVTRGGGDQLFLGGFAQVVLAPLQGLTITGNARIQLLRESNGYDGSFGGFGRIPSRESVYFEPRLDVHYSLPAGFVLRGAYYQSYLAPNLGDLFYTHSSGLFVQLPNPFLKPERLNGGEVGLDYQRDGIQIQITLYRTTVDDYIVVGRGSNPAYLGYGSFLTQNQNAASILAQGVETKLAWNIGAGFSARLSYTLANSIMEHNAVDPHSDGQQIMDVPPRTIVADLTYANFGARLSVEAQYADGNSWFSPIRSGDDAPYRSFAKSSFVVDFYGSYPISANADLYLDVENIFDRRYRALGYSEPLSTVVFGPPSRLLGGLRLSLD